MTLSRYVLLASIVVSLGIPPATLAGQATAGQTPQRRPVVSPDIQPDHRVTFRLAAPKATEVILNGDWEGGSAVPMMKDDQGVFSATVGPLAPEQRKPLQDRFDRAVRKFGEMRRRHQRA